MDQTRRAAGEHGPRQTAPGWRDYAKLARLELAVFSMFPLYGALLVRGAELPIHQAAALYAINFFFESGWIVHNDLMDFHFDRQSAAVADRALASGRIPRGHAWWMAGICLAATYVLAGIFFPRPLPLGALTLGWSFGLLYNRFGKLFLGGDFLFTGAIISLYLLGALAVIAPNTRFRDWPPMFWTFTAGAIVHYFLFNAIPGGLKDVPGDRLNGLKTFPVHFSREGPDGLAVTGTFKLLAVGLRVIALSLMVVPLMFCVSLNYWQMMVLFWIIYLALRSTVKLVNTPLGNKVKIGDRSMRSEGFIVFGVGLMVGFIAGWGWMLYMALAPFLFFAAVNCLVHGKIHRLPGNF